MVITDQHPVTHSTICDEAYRFSRFIVDDIKLSPAAASRLKELQVDAHPGYPSLGFLVPAFDGSLPKLQSLRPRNVAFWSMGMFKGLKHSSLPMEPKRYLCPSRCVTSDAISKVLHLIPVPSSANIEIDRSFCDVSDQPGANVLSCLHADLPWITAAELSPSI